MGLGVDVGVDVPEAEAAAGLADTFDVGVGPAVPLGVLVVPWVGLGVLVGVLVGFGASVRVGDGVAVAGAFSVFVGTTAMAVAAGVPSTCDVGVGRPIQLRTPNTPPITRASATTAPATQIHTGTRFRSAGVTARPPGITAVGPPACH